MKISPEWGKEGKHLKEPVMIVMKVL